MLQGLYYSYFKTVINAATLQDAMYEIMYDNVTEFPNTINTLQRFNLYPEVCRQSGFLLPTERKVMFLPRLLTRTWWHNQSSVRLAIKRI